MRRAVWAMVVGNCAVVPGMAWGQAASGGGAASARLPSRGDVLATLVNKVEGTTTILDLLPNGRAVRKGETVCKLDASALRERLVNQEAAVLQARAMSVRAVRNVEIAELSIREYNEATYPLELQRLEVWVQFAEAEVIRAQGAVKTAEKLPGIEVLTGRQARVDLIRAETALRDVKSQVSQFQNVTHPRRQKELGSTLADARAAAQTVKATLALEESRMESLRTQIEACDVKAPADGVLRLNSQVPLEEGATVSERVLLGWIVRPPAPSGVAQPAAPGR